MFPKVLSPPAISFPCLAAKITAELRVLAEKAQTEIYQGDNVTRIRDIHSFIHFIHLFINPFISSIYLFIH